MSKQAKWDATEQKVTLQRADGQELGFSFHWLTEHKEFGPGVEGFKVESKDLVGHTPELGDYVGVEWKVASENQGHGELELLHYTDREVFVGRLKVKANDRLLTYCAARIEIDPPSTVERYLSCYAFCDWWTRPYWTVDAATLPDRNQFVLWQEKDGTYGCLVPLVDSWRCDVSGRDCSSFYQHASAKKARDGQAVEGRSLLGVDFGAWDWGRQAFDVRSFALGFGTDPFELVRRVYSAAIPYLGHAGTLRWDKPYPAVFEYVGWCTWDAFYQEVNEEGILTKLRQAKAAGFPFGFMLIDDGWSPTPEGRLWDFDIDRKKFPRGLAPLIEEGKRDYGLKYIGMWHTFTGYWGGVHPDGPVGQRYRQHLLHSKEDHYIPYPDPNIGGKFWLDWHRWMRQEGVDFVKVDHQGAIQHLAYDQLPMGTAAQGAHYALEISTCLNLNGWMINCMAQASQNLWFWITSNVARSSDDYFVNRTGSHREHARQNAYNSLWMGSIVWPDWDMWHSHHPKARYHAVLRALSGGPVYVSDKAEQADWDMIWPLCDSTGRLYRCDQPGLPTRDCLLANPEGNALPLKIWNRIGNAGVLGAFSATGNQHRERKELPENWRTDPEHIELLLGPAMKGSFAPTDVEGIEGERFAVREHFSGEMRVMGPAERWEFELAPGEVLLFAVVPVVQGVAVLGLANKYAGPRTVDGVRYGDEQVSFELREGGPLVVYTEQLPETVTANGQAVPFTLEDGVLKADIPGKTPVTVVIA